MKTIFYYERTEDKKPLITICLIRKNGDYARGVAYCSFLDNPSKKRGRAIAEGRALKALKRKENNDLTTRNEPYKIAQACGTWPFPHKSSFPAQLSNIEKALIALMKAQ